MTIRFTILFLVLSSFSLKGFTQRGINYSNFFYRLPDAQPALTGIDNFLNVSLAHRQTWNDFNDGLSSVYLSSYWQISKGSKVNAKRNSLRISKPGEYDEMKRSDAFRRKHGVGIIVQSNTFDALDDQILRANYAYHLPLTKKFNASLGISTGINQIRLDHANLTVRDPVNDNLYNALIGQSGSQTTFFLNAGISAYTDKFYFAVSYNSFANQEIGRNDFMQEDLNLTNFRASLGGQIDLSQNMVLNVDVFNQYSSVFDFENISSLRIRYKDRISLGLAYHNINKLSTLAGLKISNSFYINYAFDRFSNSTINNFNNAHEIFLMFAFSNKFNSLPRFW